MLRVSNALPIEYLTDRGANASIAGGAKAVTEQFNYTLEVVNMPLVGYPLTGVLQGHAS